MVWATEVAEAVEISLHPWIKGRSCAETHELADGYEGRHMTTVLPWLRGWLPSL